MSDNTIENIKCFIRIKPEDNSLHKLKYEIIDDSMLELKEEKHQGKNYIYDFVIDDNLNQRDVYTKFGNDLPKSFLSGFNCTVFTYGQPRSDQFYTIFRNIYLLITQKKKIMITTINLYQD